MRAVALRMDYEYGRSLRVWRRACTSIYTAVRRCSLMSMWPLVLRHNQSTSTLSFLSCFNTCDSQHPCLCRPLYRCTPYPLPAAPLILVRCCAAPRQTIATWNIASRVSERDRSLSRSISLLFVSLLPLLLMVEASPPPQENRISRPQTPFHTRKSSPKPRGSLLLSFCPHLFGGKQKEEPRRGILRKSNGLHR